MKDHYRCINCAKALPLQAVGEEGKRYWYPIKGDNNDTLYVCVACHEAIKKSRGMKYSLDNETWTDPEPYATEKELTLVGGNGEHCIWAMFSDQVGNWTVPLKSCAILDTTIPGGNIKILGLEITVKFVPIKNGG